MKKTKAYTLIEILISLFIISMIFINVAFIVSKVMPFYYRYKKIETQYLLSTRFYSLVSKSLDEILTGYNCVSLKGNSIISSLGTISFVDSNIILKKNNNETKFYINNFNDESIIGIRIYDSGELRSIYEKEIIDKKVNILNNGIIVFLKNNNGVEIFYFNFDNAIRINNEEEK